MNKNLLLLALTAASTLGAAGAELPIHFDDWVNIGGNEGDFLPVHLGYKHSGSQSIYTVEDLHKLQSVVDGKDKTAEITSVTFKLTPDDAYYFRGPITISVTIQNSQETHYELVDNKYHWIDVDNTSTGTFVIGDDFDWGEAFFGGEADITITLDKPVIYNGESLVFTWSCDDSEWEYSNQTLGNPGFQASDGKIYTLASADHKNSFATYLESDSYDNYSKWRPAIKLGYNVVDVPSSGDVTFEPMAKGDMTIGPWIDNNADSEVPFDTDHEYSGSQSIYTPEMLQPALNDSETAYAEIERIRIPYAFSNVNYDVAYFDMVGAEFKVYAVLSDLTDYEADQNGNYSWIDYKNGVVGTGKLTNECENFIDAFETGDSFFIDIVFNDKIRYETGKSLVLTWACTSDMTDGYYMGDPYVFKPDSKVHSLYAKDSRTEFELMATGTTTNKTEYLPSIQLTYTPYKQVGGEVTPSLSIADESVKFSLEQVDVEAGLSGFNGLSLINRISLEFDIIDGRETDEAVYTVKLGKSELTTTGRHVKLGYLDVKSGKATITVSSAGAKPAIKEISFDAIDELFPQPTVSLDNATYYIEPRVNYQNTADLNAAVRYNMGTDGFAAIVTESNNRLIHDGTDLPDELSDYAFTGAHYNHLHENGHQASCYVKGIKSIEMQDGIYVFSDDKARISAMLKVKYPVAVLRDDDCALLSTGAQLAKAEDSTAINSTAFKMSDGKTVAPSNSSYSGVTFEVPYTDGGLTGIEDITVDDRGPAEIYNLQGVRMGSGLTRGVYIMRQGNTTCKVIVK
ncbi:MAG: hypothetical protein Q4C34_09005 [Bacteroidales bacterium]|nr:hypothetical protein [Bacteroidales bacterium]